MSKSCQIFWTFVTETAFVQLVICFLTDLFEIELWSSLFVIPMSLDAELKTKRWLHCHCPKEKWTILSRTKPSQMNRYIFKISIDRWIEMNDAFSFQIKTPFSFAIHYSYRLVHIALGNRKIIIYLFISLNRLQAVCELWNLHSKFSTCKKRNNNKCFSFLFAFDFAEF